MSISPSLTPFSPISAAEGITIIEPGYVYIYLSNENSTPVEVFFDDFTLTHTNTDIVQKDDYYPFGGSFNSYSYGLKNKFLYNKGTEFISDLTMNMYETTFRLLDPYLGRWLQIDPLSDYFSSQSPYNSMDNNPIMFNDPLGMCPECKKNVSNPSDGQIYVTAGGATYIYSNGVWTRDGGQLPAVTVTGNDGSKNVIFSMLLQAYNYLNYLDKKIQGGGEGITYYSSNPFGDDSKARDGKSTHSIDIDPFLWMPMRTDRPNAPYENLKEFLQGGEVGTLIFDNTKSIIEKINPSPAQKKKSDTLYIEGTGKNYGDKVTVDAIIGGKRENIEFIGIEKMMYLLDSTKGKWIKNVEK